MTKQPPSLEEERAPEMQEEADELPEPHADQAN